MMAPAAAFFKKYQELAPAAKVDPLGYYLGGWGYAYISVLGDAVKGAKSLDDDKIAEYLRKTTFKTIMGDWAYGPGGEWTKSGMMQVTVPRHQGGRWPGDLEGHGLPDHTDAGRTCDR